MKKTLIASALFALAASTSAFAAASAEEAQRIKTELQKYLGAEPGVVEVAPQGDAYAITIDFMPYLKKIPEAEAKATIDPQKMLATPAGDGTWNITSSGPMALSFAAKDKINFKIGMSNFDWKGVFDESISGFTSSDYTIQGLNVSQTVNEPDSKMKTSTAYTIESITGGAKSTKVGDGAADTDGTVTLKNLTASSNTEMPPEMAAGMPPMNITFSSAGGTYTSSIKNIRNKPMLEIAAWLVAHPTKELIIKDQQELKEKILAALPLLDSVASQGAINTVSIGTGVGQFATKSMGSGADFNGAVKAGRIGESFNIEGLEIPAGLVPAWATSLVPTAVSIGFSLDGFDADALVRQYVTQMDLAKDPPMSPEANNALWAAVLPGNTFNVEIPPGKIVAAAYELNYSGKVAVNTQGPPAGSAKIGLKGIDAIISTAQEAAKTDDRMKQVVQMIIAAKGLGKTESDGTMSWDINYGADGKLLINGIDASALAPPAP